MTASDQQPVCVITGGSVGVGLAAALRFAGLGYRVVICGRDAPALEQARQKVAALGPDCGALALDLTEPASSARLIDTAQSSFGRLDVLINNAGHAPLYPVEQMPEEEFQKALAINVEAVFHTTKAAWPVWQKQRGGILINISSLASVDPFTGFSVYGACKAWVNLFTKAVADEGRPFGIRAYSVALGAVETRMLRGLFPDFPREQTLTPEEVALFLSSLCGESMRYASGQTLILKK
jgi:3-oxoacyl-[acyl-carrier protein] reductase